MNINANNYSIPQQPADIRLDASMVLPLLSQSAAQLKPEHKLKRMPV